MDFPHELFAVAQILTGGNLKVISQPSYNKEELKIYIERCSKLGVSRNTLTIVRQIRFSFHEYSEWERVS